MYVLLAEVRICVRSQKTTNFAGFVVSKLPVLNSGTNILLLNIKRLGVTAAEHGISLDSRWLTALSAYIIIWVTF